MSRSIKAHLLLVLITLIWGSTFVLIKEALNDSSPLVLNAVRMGLAAVLLALYYRKKIAVLTKPALTAGVVVGVFLYLGYALQTSGLKLTTPSKSAFLTGTSTVMVPLVLVAIWRAHIHLWRVAGIVLALAGLFLMTVPAGGEGLADFAKVNFGDVLTVGCAFGFAFQIVFLGRASQRFPFEQIAVLQIGTAAVLMALTAPFLEQPHFRPTGTVIGGRSHYRHSGYGRGFHRAGLGATIYPRHPYRADLHPGTGLCLADVFYLSERAAWSSGRCGRAADPGRGAGFRTTGTGGATGRRANRGP